MNKVLVTGASGQLGKAIQEIHQNYPNLIFTFKNKYDLDITDFNITKSVIERGDFDYIINCAAYTNVEKAENNTKDALLVNVKGVQNLVEVCSLLNIRLIHISTDYVFDGEKKIPYVVGDATNPINEYGKSKLLGEQYIQSKLKQYFIIRTSWLYSKKYGNNFYRTILKKAMDGENLSVTNEQIGCPTDASNLSKYLINLINLQNEKYGIYHFTDGKQMTWYDFAKEIITTNNLENISLEVRINKQETIKRPKYSVLK